MDDPLELPGFLDAPPSPGWIGPPGAGSRVVRLDLRESGTALVPGFEGVRLLPELISVDEAERLLAEIERREFLPSQSGRQKQHFGARVNFNKRRLKLGDFSGLPGYVHWLETRMRARLESVDDGLARALAGFEATDLFVLRYRDEDLSNLDPHVDDVFAYGELILDLSLESDSVMTFLRPRVPAPACVPASAPDEAEPAWDCVRVVLPVRSLLLLYGPARFEWEHAILPFDVHGQRTSLTIRTLSPSLRGTADGRRVREIARRSRSIAGRLPSS